MKKILTLYYGDIKETLIMTSTTSSGQVFVGLRADDRTMLRVPLSSVLFSVVRLLTAIDCPGTPPIGGVKNSLLLLRAFSRRCVGVWECRSVKLLLAAYMPFIALATFTC